MALKFGEGYLLLGVDQKFLNQELSGAKASFQKSLGSMQAISNKARIALAAGFGVGAIATKITAGFEQGMARVRALTGAVGAEFTALGDTAKQLGRTTVFSARQAADAMGFFALAGFEATQILKAMPSTLNLAAAGQLDVAQAADIAAKIMKGMGLSAEELEHATDVMAKAFTSANTDLIQLGEAMKFIGPIARSAGLDLEEVVATIQVLSNAGIQGAMAGTSLRRALTSLSQIKGPAADVFRAIGVETQTAAGRLRPLADIIDDFADKLSRLGEAQRIALIMQAFGLRAGPAMAALISEGGDAIRKFQKDLENAGGTAKRIAEIQMDTLQGRLIKLKSATEGLAIAIGEPLLPAFKRLTDQVTAFTGNLADMDEQTTRQILVFGKFLGATLAIVAVGPALFKFFAIFLSSGALAITTIAGTVGLLATAFAKAKVEGVSFDEALGDLLRNMLGIQTPAERLVAIMERFAEKTGDVADAMKTLRSSLPDKSAINAVLELLGIGEEKKPVSAREAANAYNRLLKEDVEATKLIAKTERERSETKARMEELLPGGEGLISPKHAVAWENLAKKIGTIASEQWTARVRQTKVRAVLPEAKRLLEEAVRREGTLGIRPGETRVKEDRARVKAAEREVERREESLSRAEMGLKGSRARQAALLAEGPDLVRSFPGFPTKKERFLAGAPAEIAGAEEEIRLLELDLKAAKVSVQRLTESLKIGERGQTEVVLAEILGRARGKLGPAISDLSRGAFERMMLPSRVAAFPGAMRKQLGPTGRALSGAGRGFDLGAIPKIGPLLRVLQAGVGAAQAIPAGMVGQLAGPKAEGGAAGFVDMQDFWRQMQIGKESPADKKRNDLLGDIAKRLPKSGSFWEEMKDKLGMFE